MLILHTQWQGQLLTVHLALNKKVSLIRKFIDLIFTLLNLIGKLV